MRRPLALMGIALAAWLWVAALLAAPLAASGDINLTPTMGIAVYLAGSLICHQRPERSFHLSDVRMPVCARCSGLYIGGAIGVVAWIAVAGMRQSVSRTARAFVVSSAPRTLLITLSVPTLITVMTAMAGIWDPGNVTRAALALPLGLGIGGIVGAVAAGDLR
jgi:uncharacterized membrane protein